jgi:NAD(P)-dependent dehydrogenase (short-subunit alcohol dehydrogenase family)
MTTRQLTGANAVVTGASRGLGRGIATALHEAGAHVVGLARDSSKLAELQAQLGERFTPMAADASDPTTAGQVMDAYRPRILVLAAGARPLSRPLHQHTWQTFSRNWDVDVKQAFHWIREALLMPLEPGSVVLAMSSGAAVRGSALSGGYAGAKAAIRFTASYAQDESNRAGLGIRFLSVLPQLTPATELGAMAVAAYAARAGLDVAGYRSQLGPALTPETAGKSFVELATNPQLTGSFMLTAGGLAPAP